MDGLNKYVFNGFSESFKDGNAVGDLEGVIDG